MTQGRLLLVDEPTQLVHAGPCALALVDEIDATDPAQVTCPDCRRACHPLGILARPRGAK